MEKIFVATDGSEGGKRAVSYAARLAANTRGELSIVTVTAAAPSAAWREYAQAEHLAVGDLIEVEAEDVLQKARALALKEGTVPADCHALVGDAAEQILDLIVESKPGVVVVGRRGRGRLVGLLLGSVSQKLASLSPVPVIIVP